MKVEEVQISDLKAATYNPRKLSADQELSITQSLTRFGFVDPIIAAEKNQRQARIMEMDRGFCDVIVQRYVTFCKKNKIKRNSLLHQRDVRKTSKTFDLLGCNITQFIKHLESQFKPGMTWENYGKVWHVDHEKLLGFLEVGSRNAVNNMRVIPQIHKILKVK